MHKVGDSFVEGVVCASLSPFLVSYVRENTGGPHKSPIREERKRLTNALEYY